jgi:hypothetical protein
MTAALGVLPFFTARSVEQRADQDHRVRHVDHARLHGPAAARHNAPYSDIKYSTSAACSCGVRLSAKRRS